MSATAATIATRDRDMIAHLWPLLIAAALGLVPFTVMSTFLVPIAEGSGATVEVIGGMRGLGGVAALAVGALAAPLVDRLPRGRTGAVALVVLGAGCVLATMNQVAGWAIFSVLIGAGTSLLNPALAAMAADRYDDDATSGRAATMVSATTTLTAVLSAPLLAAPALLWGWQGDLVIAAIASVGVAVALWHRHDTRAPGTVRRPGYLAALREAAQVPGALRLLAISLTRTACFMGQLAYVAAFYSARFGLSAQVFAMVWTLSGAAFFCGNWWAGRAMARADAPRRAPKLIAVGACVAMFSSASLFLAPWLPVALVGTAGTAVGHAVVAAGIVTLLVRRAGDVRGTVMSLNGAAQSLGVFIGTAAVGAAMALGAWTAVALLLAAGLAGCAVLALTLRDERFGAPARSA